MTGRTDLSACRLLTWSVTILLLCAGSVSMSDDADPYAGWNIRTCTMPSVEEGQLATLYCKYETEMYPGRTNIDLIVQRSDTPEGEKEEPLYCQWETDQYKCETPIFEVTLSLNATPFTKFYFPYASKRHEGWYHCRSVGIDNSRPEPCRFTLKKPPTTTTSRTSTAAATQTPRTGTEKKNGGGVSKGWKVLACILLVVLIVCLLFGIYRLYIWHKTRYLQYKPVVVSNTIEALVSTVCSMKLNNAKFEKPESVHDAWLLVSTAGTGSKEEMTPSVADVMKCLWKDPGLQRFFQENEKRDSSAAYFLKALDRIGAPDYQPTEEDVDKMWTRSSDEKTAFTFKVLHCMTLMLKSPTCVEAGGAKPDELSPGETDPLLAGNSLLAHMKQAHPALRFGNLPLDADSDANVNHPGTNSLLERLPSNEGFKEEKSSPEKKEPSTATTPVVEFLPEGKKDQEAFRDIELGHPKE